MGVGGGVGSSGALPLFFVLEHTVSALFCSKDMASK